EVLARPALALDEDRRRRLRRAEKEAEQAERGRAPGDEAVRLQPGQGRRVGRCEIGAAAGGISGETSERATAERLAHDAVGAGRGGRRARRSWPSRRTRRRRASSPRRRRLPSRYP